MAIINVTIIEGRPQAVKDDLIARLTDAVVVSLGARPEQVRVVISEVKDGSYGVAGKAVWLGTGKKQ
jgi:4-oxalocrotonate tautomerase